jgi:hypothetical protein
VEVVEDKLLVTPVPPDLLERLRGSLAGGADLLEDLRQDHREEIEREEADLAGWRVKDQTGRELASATVGEGEDQ